MHYSEAPQKTALCAESRVTAVPYAWLALAGIVGVGTLLRLHGAGYNFDGDEIISVTHTLGSFGSMISAALGDTTHPPLHIILLHLWFNIFGETEVAARSLSVLFSLGFLTTSYFLSRRFVSWPYAIFVVGILALSPLFVFYGQQARPYSLAAMLTALNLLAYFNVLEKPGSHLRLATWLLTIAAMLYTQYLLALFVVIELAVAILYLKRAAVPTVLYGCLAIASVFPWMILAMAPRLGGGEDPLGPISWMVAPELTDLIWYYIAFFGDSSIVRVRWLVLALLIGFALYGWRVLRSKSISAPEATLIACASLVPLTVFVLSVWGPTPMFVPRQLLGSGIAVVILLGVALAKSDQRVALSIVAFLLGYMSFSVHQAFPEYRRPPWQAVATYIESTYEGSNVHAQEAWVANPINFYLSSSSATRVGTKQTISATGAEVTLYICRISDCTALQEPPVGTEARLAATWDWDGGASELRLYELRSM